MYALSGYWQGFVTGAFATAGLLLGGIFGVWLAPRALGNAEPSAWVSIGALFIVILAASLGQALQYAGARIRDRITWQPIRAVDAFRRRPCPRPPYSWSPGCSAWPSPARAWVASPNRCATQRCWPRSTRSCRTRATGCCARSTTSSARPFPRYLEPFARERIIETDPGPQRRLRDPDVVDAAPSVVKIRAVNTCGSGVEGTGFVYADGRVMTNAHVVAGVDEAEVNFGDTVESARVVVYDPELDIAVLDVDTSGVATLPFAFTGKAGTGVAILGYPEDGPYDVQPGRIRAEQRLRSPDIYGRGTVIRDVYSLRGKVRPGNSGGPILSSGGDVLGMIFAASITNADTGYALTAEQMRERAAQGVTSGSPVDTGACVR